MAEQTIDGVSFSEIARQQGCTRATITARRSRGWTDEEILAGKRGERKGKRVMKDYSTLYSDKLGGFSIAEVARYNNISPSGLYYRLSNDVAFALPEKKT